MKKKSQDFTLLVLISQLKLELSLSGLFEVRSLVDWLLTPKLDFVILIPKIY